MMIFENFYQKVSIIADGRSRVHFVVLAEVPVVYNVADFTTKVEIIKLIA